MVILGAIQSTTTEEGLQVHQWIDGLVKAWSHAQFTTKGKVPEGRIKLTRSLSLQDRDLIQRIPPSMFHSFGGEAYNLKVCYIPKLNCQLEAFSQNKAILVGEEDSPSARNTLAHGFTGALSKELGKSQSRPDAVFLDDHVWLTSSPRSLGSHLDSLTPRGFTLGRYYFDVTTKAHSFTAPTAVVRDQNSKLQALMA